MIEKCKGILSRLSLFWRYFFLLSAVVLVHSGILLPAALSLCFGFLTIRAADETTIMDYLRYAVRYFLSTQQYFEWRLTD